MKRIVLMLAAVIVLSGCAGNRSMAPRGIQVQRVVEVPNATKEVLFDKSRMWYATAFRSANTVIQYENKDNGTIMGNGTLSGYIFITPVELRISVSTEAKDGKARITATGLTINVDRQGEHPARELGNFKPQVEEIINGYEQYLKSSVASTKTDNW